LRFDKIGAATPFARKSDFAQVRRERDDEAGALVTFLSVNYFII
jgi:hypothetical protein